MTPAIPNAGVIVGCIGRVSTSLGFCGEVIFRGADMLDEGLVDVVNDDSDSDEAAPVVEVVSLAGEGVEERPGEFNLGVAEGDASMEVEEGEASPVVEGLLP